MSFFANEAIFSCKVAYMVGFGLLRTKICVIDTFVEKLLEIKRWKSKKKFKMLAKTESDTKIETIGFIIMI